MVRPHIGGSPKPKELFPLRAMVTHWHGEGKGVVFRGGGTRPKAALRTRPEVDLAGFVAAASSEPGSQWPDLASPARASPPRSGWRWIGHILPPTVTTSLAYVTAQLVDEKGESFTMPKEDVRLQFKVSGAGTLAGVGNGDPTALESSQSGVRSTYRGHAVAVVRVVKAPGPITVEVSAEPLPTASVQITSH